MLKAANRGFTLIEMVVTILIVGILATISAPSFSDFIAAQRVKGASTDLVSDLLAARNEAINRGIAVAVGPIDPASWNTGWKIYFGATTIKQRDISSGSITLAKTAGSPNEVVFFPNGRSSNASTFMMELTPVVGNVSSNKRCVTVDSASGIKTLKAACS